MSENRPVEQPQPPPEPGVRYLSNGWVVKKQINYGDLIGFAGVVVAVVVPLTVAFFTWSIEISKQVTVNAQHNVQQDYRIDRLEARTEKALQRIEDKLDKINDTLVVLAKEASKRGSD